MYAKLILKWREAQKSDPTIHPVLESKLSGSRPPCKDLKTFSPKTKCLFREWDKLTIDSNGILYRTTPAHKQLLLPEKYRGKVLNELHNEMGHQGVDRTVSLIRDRV